MPKTRIRLDEIRIMSPCPASWEDMQGNDRVRFCSIRSKNVYNLSAMTSVEAELLLKEKEGRLCGRIYLRKDGSVMTSDCPVGLSAIRKRFVKRIAGVAALVISLFGGRVGFSWNFTTEMAIE
jgi:hypothetical protein